MPICIRQSILIREYEFFEQIAIAILYKTGPNNLP